MLAPVILCTINSPKLKIQISYRRQNL